MRRRSARMGFGIGFVTLAMTLSGCSGSDVEPNSPGAFATYACALAEDLDTPADQWPREATDDESTSGLMTAFTIRQLLGGEIGLDLKGYEEISEAAREFNSGLQTVDYEKLDAGLADIRSACEKTNLDTNDVDVSPEGRLEFACSNLEEIYKSHTPVAEWMDEISDSDAAKFLFVRTASINGIMGNVRAVIGDGSDGSTEELAATFDVREGLSELDPEQTEAGLETLNDFCIAR